MSEEEKKPSFPIPFLVGAGIVIVVLAGVLLLNRYSVKHGSAALPPLPFTDVEQAYAAKVRFIDLKMSVATNLLNQEFTYLDGIMSNDGTRSIREMEVSLEFHDQFGQVVLRDARRLLRTGNAPLASLEKREFQITFEHISDFWNQQPPTLRVTGLLLD